MQAGFGGCRAYVGEKLSYPEERIVSGTVREIAEKIFAPLAVLVVKREKTADDIGNDTVSAKKDSENSVTGSCWRERAKTHGPGLLDDWFGPGRGSNDKTGGACSCACKARGGRRESPL